MKKYELLNTKNIKLEFSLEEKYLDYYSDVYITLFYDMQEILIYKDNLLNLKNIIENYNLDKKLLNTELDEKLLGIQLNDYYNCVQNEENTENFILDDNGYWIGERLFIFSTLQNATWLFLLNNNIFFKVTPLFNNFEQEYNKKKYKEFCNSYKDCVNEKITKEQFLNFKKNLESVFNKYMERCYKNA